MFHAISDLPSSAPGAAWLASTNHPSCFLAGLTRARCNRGRCSRSRAYHGGKGGKRRVHSARVGEGIQLPVQGHLHTARFHGKIREWVDLGSEDCGRAATSKNANHENLAAARLAASGSFTQTQAHALACRSTRANCAQHFATTQAALASTKFNLETIAQRRRHSGRKRSSHKAVAVLGTAGNFNSAAASARRKASAHQRSSGRARFQRARRHRRRRTGRGRAGQAEQSRGGRSCAWNWSSASQQTIVEMLRVAMDSSHATKRQSSLLTNVFVARLANNRRDHGRRRDRRHSLIVHRALLAARRHKVLSAILTVRSDSTDQVRVGLATTAVTTATRVLLSTTVVSDRKQTALSLRKHLAIVMVASQNDRSLRAVGGAVGIAVSHAIHQKRATTDSICTSTPTSFKALRIASRTIAVSALANLHHLNRFGQTNIATVTLIARSAAFQLLAQTAHQKRL
jgi:hypothetical protein